MESPWRRGAGIPRSSLGTSSPPTTSTSKKYSVLLEPSVSIPWRESALSATMAELPCEGPVLSTAMAELSQVLIDPQVPLWVLAASLLIDICYLLSLPRLYRLD